MLPQAATTTPPQLALPPPPLPPVPHHRATPATRAPSVVGYAISPPAHKGEILGLRAVVIALTKAVTWRQEGREEGGEAAGLGEGLSPPIRVYKPGVGSAVCRGSAVRPDLPHGAPKGIPFPPLQESSSARASPSRPRPPSLTRAGWRGRERAWWRRRRRWARSRQVRAAHQAEGDGSADLPFLLSRLATAAAAASGALAGTAGRDLPPPLPRPPQHTQSQQ